MAAADRPLVVSVVLADQLVGSFGLGVCHEVFGYDRRHMGLPRFDFGLVAESSIVAVTNHPTHIAMTVRCPRGHEHVYRTGRRWESRRAEQLVGA